MIKANRLNFGIIMGGILLAGILVAGCGKETDPDKKEKTEQTFTSSKELVDVKKVSGTLPEDIEWLTNTSDPVFASEKAVKGGTLRLPIMSFPMTFRTVGPDSNGSFRGNIGANLLGLIDIHPNTENVTPSLATHWAYGKDNKTMYFKLNKKAMWSDGVPVTAWDFAYTLDFMRSKHIVAPWYNHHYTEEIDTVIVFDDYTLAIRSTKPKPELQFLLPFSPVPGHFFGKLDDSFVKQYNWAVVPNTGPYQISDFKKGKYVTFERKKDWWAKELTYYKNRFNVDKVKFSVIREFNITWENFLKNNIDIFRITYPRFWHEKTQTPVVENGYVHKIWFFNDTQRSPQGFYINQNTDLFKNRNLRLAFAHAINVDKVIKKVLRNDYFRLNQAFEGYGEYTNTSIKARPYDIDKVAEYMTQEGWQRGSDGIWEKDGKRFSFEVTYSFDEITERLIVLKQDAKKAGIEMNLQKLDGSAAFKKFLEKKHTVAFMAWSTGLRPRYWQFFHSDNAGKPQTNNITNTADPELDALIEKYRNSLEVEERKSLSVKIQQMLHDMAMYVPTMKVPYIRQAYWRWWRLPEVPGTKHSNDLFDPFGAGLFWYDKQLHDETIDAMKTGKTFGPVTIIDETFKRE